MVDVEAKVDLREAVDALPEETGPEDEGHGQPDLRDDEEVGPPSRLSDATGTLQLLDDREAPRGDGRDRPYDQAGEGGEQEVEDEAARSDLPVEEDRQPSGHEALDDPSRGEGDEPCAEARRQPQKQALDDRALKQAIGSCPEGQSHGGRLSPFEPQEDEEIHAVGPGYDQQEEAGSREGQQHGPGGRSQLLAQGDDTQAPAGVGIGKLRGQVLSCGAQLRLGLGDGDSRAQTSHGPVPEGVTALGQA